MSSQDDLKERFLKFREKKYAMPLGMAIALLLGLLLIPFLGAICFGALLIAIIGFYIPYYFGLRDRRKLAAWGLAFVLVLSLAFTWMAVPANVDAMAGKHLNSEDGILIDGFVDPYRAEGATTHLFSVTVAGTPMADYNVHVVITNQYSLEEVGNKTMLSRGEVAGGERFEVSADLENPALYSFHFSTDAPGEWVRTAEGYGPVHVSNLNIFIHYLPMFTFSMFLQIGLLFYMLLAFNWYSERSRARMEEVMRQRKEMRQGPFDDGVSAGELFECSGCGADVPANAKRCPQCGEWFEDEDPKAGAVDVEEYECSECGAAVGVDAERCWKCGKEFED